MKARTKAAKIKAKRGRPPKDGLLRTESGRISRSAEGEEAAARLACEAATWRRRRDNPSLSIDEARHQEHGSVIHRWRLQSQATEKRMPGQTHLNRFTAMHLDTARRFHELHCDYHAIIGASPPRSASDLGRVRGADSADPFEPQRAKREAAVIASYRDARRTILDSGPFGMMAIEAVVIENKDCPDMIGDLRLALNALAVLWKMQAAA